MRCHAIIVIVERGKANAIIKRAVEAGAYGATTIFGRGSGEQVFSFFRSLQVEASKEILMIIVQEEKLQKIFEVVVDYSRVRENGKGIAFTVPLENVTGINLSGVSAAAGTGTGAGDGTPAQS